MAGGGWVRECLQERRVERWLETEAATGPGEDLEERWLDRESSRYQ